MSKFQIGDLVKNMESRCPPFRVEVLSPSSSMGGFCCQTANWGKGGDAQSWHESYLELIEPANFQSWENLLCSQT